MLDVDPEGVLRESEIAYGFPRFALEDVQFDTRFKATDVQHRYLHAMAFGISGAAMWSQDQGGFQQFQYGLGMFLNRNRYSMPNFPKTVMGPKIAYKKETRLLGFFPTAGYQYEVAVIPSPLEFKNSLVSVKGARTFNLYSLAYLTLTGEVMTVGSKGVSSRLFSRVGAPLGTHETNHDDLAEIFLQVGAGSDQYDGSIYSGYSGILGLRYHSSGFIAELSIKVTKLPDQFDRLLTGGGG